VARPNILRLRPQGVIADVPPENVPLEHWTSARNMAFRPGLAEPVGGYLEVWGTPLHAPRFADPVIVFGSGAPIYYWLYFGATGAGVTDGIAHSDITPAGYAPSAANRMTATRLNGIPVYSSSAMQPHYWPGSPAQDLAPLPGWFGATTRAAWIRGYKNFLVAGNISSGASVFPHQVRWSASAPAGSLPGVWTPASTNDAGQRETADLSGVLLDARIMGDALFLYKQGGVYALQYIGGPLVMSLRALERHTGVLSQNSVVEVYRRHVVFGMGDLYTTDGQQVTSIADGRVRRRVFDNIDPAQYPLCQAMHHKARSEVWFCYPEGGRTELTLAAVWNYAADTWSFRELAQWAAVASGITGLNTGEPVAWDGDAQAWDDAQTVWNSPNFTPTQDAAVACDELGARLLAIDASPLADGVPVQCAVERATVPFNEDGTARGLISHVWPKLKGNPGEAVEVQIGTQTSPDNAIAWGARRTFVIGTDDKVDVFAEGNYLSLRVEGANPGAWQLTGADVHWMPAGEF
jgi:hypothetical protein